MAQKISDDHDQLSVIFGAHDKVGNVNPMFGMGDNPFYTYARNATLDSPLGDKNTLSNEQSNRLAATVQTSDYKGIIIGTIHIENDEWAIFSTDEAYGEIGIYSEDSETYKLVIRSDKFNFHKTHLIRGCSRVLSDCYRNLYWDDGLNPTRWIDLNSILNLENRKDAPFIKVTQSNVCKTKVYETINGKYELDTDAIRLASIVNPIQMRMNRGSEGGSITTGAYVAYAAYSSGDTILSNFTTSTQPVHVFDSMEGSSAQLIISIDGIDNVHFDTFNLIIGMITAGVPSFFNVGQYSTNSSTIIVDSLTSGQSLKDPKIILQENPNPVKSKACFNVDNRLYRTSPSIKPDFNYQPLANNIRACYVVSREKSDYYRNGGTNVGYMRGESYAFFIRWVFNNGEKTNSSYFIPNNDNDAVVTDKSNYANLLKENKYGWADVNNFGNLEKKWSTETYPNNKSDIWGNLCGEKICFHKFPDNIPITDKQNNINILGIAFFNIAPPERDGQPIEGIAGFEILRGDRNGNKTVIAKGLINNMRLVDTFQNDLMLMQNYPLNNRGDDSYLVRYKSYYGKKKTTTDVKKDYISFAKNKSWNDSKFQFYNIPFYSISSPELVHTRYKAVGGTLKAENIMQGNIQSYFIYPDGHPKHKLISNGLFTVSITLGLGYALAHSAGLTTTAYNGSSVDYGGTYTALGTSSGTTGMAGPSAPASILQSVMSFLGNGLMVAAKNLINDVANIATVIKGGNPGDIFQTSALIADKTTGTAGGRSGYLTTSYTDTEYMKIPMALRLFSGPSLFINQLTLGTDNYIDILLNTVKYEQHAVIQTDYCFYGNVKKIDDDIEKEVELENLSYIHNGGGFVGTGPDLSDNANFEDNSDFNGESVLSVIQKSDTDVRFNEYLKGKRFFVNNNRRQDFVALKTSKAFHEKIFGDVSGGREHFPIKSYYTEEDQIPLSTIVGKKRKDEFWSKALYGSIRVDMDNQYGQLTNVKQLIASPYPLNTIDNGMYYSGPIFGGDTYINRYTEKNIMPFFTDTLPVDGRYGAFHDYSEHTTIPFPKYWANFEKFTTSDFIQSIASCFKWKDETDDDNDAANYKALETVQTGEYGHYSGNYDTSFSIYVQNKSCGEYNDDILTGLYNVLYYKISTYMDSVKEKGTKTDGELADGLEKYLNEKVTAATEGYFTNTDCDNFNKYAWKCINYDSEKEELSITTNGTTLNPIVLYGCNQSSFSEVPDKVTSSINNHGFKVDGYSVVVEEVPVIYDYSEKKYCHFSKSIVKQYENYENLANTELAKYNVLKSLIKYMDRVGLEWANDSEYDDLRTVKNNPANLVIGTYEKKGMTKYGYKVCQVLPDFTGVGSNTSQTVETIYTDDYMELDEYGVVNGVVTNLSDAYTQINAAIDYYGTVVAKINTALGGAGLSDTIKIAANYESIVYNSNLSLIDANVSYKLYSDMSALVAFSYTEDSTEWVSIPNTNFLVKGSVADVNAMIEALYDYYSAYIPFYSSFENHVFNYADIISVKLYSMKSMSCNGNLLDFLGTSTKIETYLSYRDVIVNSFYKAETTIGLLCKNDFYNNVATDLEYDYGEYFNYSFGFKIKLFIKNTINDNLASFITEYCSNHNIFCYLFGSGSCDKDGTDASDEKYNYCEIAFFGTSIPSSWKNSSTGGIESIVQLDSVNVYPFVSSNTTITSSDINNFLFRVSVMTEEAENYYLLLAGTESELWDAGSRNQNLNHWVKGRTGESGTTYIDYNNDFVSTWKTTVNNGGARHIPKRVDHNDHDIEDYFEIKYEHRNTLAEYNIWRNFHSFNSNDWWYYVVNGGESIIYNKLLPGTAPYMAESIALQKRGKKYVDGSVYKNNLLWSYRLDENLERVNDTFSWHNWRTYKRSKEGSIADYLQSYMTTYNDLLEQQSTYASEQETMYLESSSDSGSNDSSGDGIIEVFKKIQTPNRQFCLSMNKKVSGLRPNIKNAFFYLSVNGVRDFYCESTLDISARGYSNVTGRRFFDEEKYNAIPEMFDYRTGSWKYGDEFIFNDAFASDGITSLMLPLAQLQDGLYNPKTNEQCYENGLNRLIWSHPFTSLQDKFDAWRMFDYADNNDYVSRPVSVNELFGQGIAVFFENMPPQLYGNKKLTIGEDNIVNVGTITGELKGGESAFNGHHSLETGSCPSTECVLSTPSGLYNISPRSGKISTYGNSGMLLTNDYLDWWLEKYIPTQLTITEEGKKTFKNVEFEYLDNPVVGVGYQTAYDSENDVLYFSKTDYKIRQGVSLSYIGNLQFRVIDGIGRGLITRFKDPAYFEDASWTVSCKVTREGLAIISFHDWHPALTMQSKNNFMTIREGDIWVHNDNKFSFCNFYGVQYPFVVEFPASIKGGTRYLNDIKYYMEAYKYADNGHDRYHVLDANFDKAIVFNSEQCSGNLTLDLTPKNNTAARLQYPFYSTTDGTIHVLYSKEEQTYRINMFRDMVRDRGEFSTREQFLFNTEANGYISQINQMAINYQKSELEHKKFLHIMTKVRLTKEDSGDINYILLLGNPRVNTSFR